MDLSEPVDSQSDTAQPLSTRLPSARPRSVYIHVPFCRHRCGYCNFTLVAGRDYLVDRFLAALQVEIERLDSRYELDTLFLGGGTPSHLSVAALQRLRTILTSRFDWDETTEISAECNPNDLNEEKSSALADFGVNRISLGVQSLNSQKLIRLERDHSLADVRQSVQLAKQFARSVSLDLIFAAPGETLIQWQQDLKTALELEPDHLSTYELTYEKGTQFWNRRLQGALAESDEELRANMYESATEIIAAAGLAAYEVSSFARPGHQCCHNESYWTGRPYFAFGPGASRYVDRVRETNHQSTTRYLQLIEAQQSPIAFSEKLSPLDSAKELLAIGLRRVVGVDEEAFETLTGFQVADLLARNSDTWIHTGLLIHADANWRLTFRGRMLCDRMASEILK